MKQIKITAMTVYITDIPVRLMRRHGSGDVAGSVKNAILKLETDAGITGWGDAARRNYPEFRIIRRNGAVVAFEPNATLAPGAFDFEFPDGTTTIY